MFGDAIDERITSLRMLDEETLDANGQPVDVVNSGDGGEDESTDGRDRGVCVHSEASLPFRARTQTGRHRALGILQHLETEEHAHRAELFGGGERKRADDGELKRTDGTDDEKQRVRLVQRRAVALVQDEHRGV